jgi:hypothetical protein
LLQSGALLDQGWDVLLLFQSGGAERCHGMLFWGGCIIEFRIFSAAPAMAPDMVPIIIPPSTLEIIVLL